MITFRDRVKAGVSAFQRPFMPSRPTVPSRGEMPTAPLQPPASRPSYDLAGLGPFLGPYWHVPLASDYALLRKLRETIPVMDMAVVWLRKLIGVPAVECEDEDLQEDIRAWLEQLNVNRIQVGWSNWVETWIDDMLTYGRTHAEMVLNNERTDIYGILELHPGTVALRSKPDGYSLDVVQYQSMGGVPVLLNPDLNLTAVNDIRSDDPNGTSLFHSLPFVGEIYVGMLRSLNQTWGRFGTPTFHVNWEEPEGWNDPTGAQATKILGAIQGNFQTAMLDRANGLVRDFFSNGKVTVSVIGAEGDTLDFEVPSRALMEQIVAKTGLPAFLLGLHWATTERMSTMQATLLAENVQGYRDQIMPKLRRLIELRQALVGRPGDFKLAWPEVSLMDRMEEGRADWMEAQAEQINLENWQTRARLGINSMEDMAREFRPELAEFDDEKVKQLCPDLVDKPPDLPVPGMGGKPGGPPQGPNASGESTRAFDLPFGSISYGGGNGRH